MSSLECLVCGARFKDPVAEAKHRHNFPVMCRVPKLSSTQKRAAAKFDDDKPRSAYDAKESIATLRSLVSKRVLVDVTPRGPGGMFSPATHYKFVRSLLTKHHLRAMLSGQS